MKIHSLTINHPRYPSQLKDIANPPRNLFYIGASPKELLLNPSAAIVGSRKVSNYGIRITEELASNLARKGVVIVSGLALGVDAIAHKAAIEAGGVTIAVLPCGLDRVYPATNRNLAKKIIDSGGCLVSEYPTLTEPMRQNFIARNRIVSGLAQVLVITEAAEKSGSLHTAKFALEQGRDVGAVPGNVYSITSIGTNNLIKTGAALITCVDDVLNLLGIEDTSLNKEIIADSAEEYILIKLMKAGLSDSEELLRQTGLAPAIFNQTLTMLEISGKAKAVAGHWYLI